MRGQTTSSGNKENNLELKTVISKKTNEPTLIAYWNSEEDYLYDLRDQTTPDYLLHRRNIDIINDNEHLRDFSTLTGLDFTLGYFFQRNFHNRDYKKKEYYANTYVLQDHLNGEKTVALPRFKESKIVIFDIDKRNNKVQCWKILRKLTEYIGEGFYYEKNRFTGGYHIWYKFNQYVPDSFLRYLRKLFLTEHGMVIEPIVGDSNIRIPYSAAYSIAGTYNPKIRHRINQVHTFEKVYDLFKSSKEKSFTQFMNRSVKFGESIQGSRTYKNITQKSESELNFEYGNGTRHIQQPRIAAFVLQRNGGYSLFEQLCRKYDDGTSKDMNSSKPGHAEKTMQNVWNWCEANFHYEFIGDNKSSSSKDLDEPATFIYRKNREYELTLDEKSNLSRILRYFYRKNVYGKIAGVHEKRFIEDAVDMYKVIKQKEQYNRDTNFRYEAEHLHFLNGSIPLGNEFVTNVAKYVGLQNPLRIIKFFVQIGLLQLVTNENGFSFSYKRDRYCKHYRIASFDRLERMFYLHRSIHKYNRYDEMQRLLDLANSFECPTELFPIYETTLSLDEINLFTLAIQSVVSSKLYSNLPLEYKLYNKDFERHHSLLGGKSLTDRLKPLIQQRIRDGMCKCYEKIEEFEPLETDTISYGFSM